MAENETQTTADAGAGETTTPPVGSNGHAAEPYVWDEEQEPVPFFVRDKRSKVVERFEVREMGEEDLQKWAKEIARRQTVGADGRVKKVEFKGMMGFLICLCVYGEDGNPVPEAKVARWGTRLKAETFAKCEEVNGLSHRSAEREGKG
jgi:hypothetical protein